MSISDGVQIACSDERRRGGLKTLWLTERDNVTTFTPGSDHEYTDVTLTGTTVQFYKFEFTDFTGGGGTEGTDDNGSDVQNLAFEFHVAKMEKVKAAALQCLKSSCKVIAVYEDFNENFFVGGFDEILGKKAALSPVVDELIGTALQDENGYVMKFTGQAAELQREFTGDTTDAAKFEQ